VATSTDVALSFPVPAEGLASTSHSDVVVVAAAARNQLLAQTQLQPTLQGMYALKAGQTVTVSGHVLFCGFLCTKEKPLGPSM